MTSIIVNNTTNVVLYAQAGLTLSAQGASNGSWTDPNCTAANYSLVDGGAIPTPFLSQAYAFANGVWTIINQSAITAYQAQLAAQAAAQVAARQAVLARANVPLITASYNAALQRQAAKLAAKGKTAQATALYLQAAGVLP